MYEYITYNFLMKVNFIKQSYNTILIFISLMYANKNVKIDLFCNTGNYSKFWFVLAGVGGPWIRQFISDQRMKNWDKLYYLEQSTEK